MKTLAAVLMLSLAAWSCASSGQRTGERFNPNLITADELQRITAANAFDAVRQLRPRFLTRRGPSSLRDTGGGYAVVRMDASLLGELSHLRNISTDMVVSIEYINASDATTRWGTGYTAGAILVTTRR